MKAEDALNMAKSYVRKTAEGLGAVKGKDGKDGISPTIVENTNNTDGVYKLDITDVNGTFTTPNLKGYGGTDGTSVLDDTTSSLNTTYSSSKIESTFAKSDDVTAALEGKVDTVVGKGLSTNDYTTEEKTKLASLENYDDTTLSQRVTDIENDYAKTADMPTVPTKTSELTNDSGYITNIVDDLLNYYKKSDTYSKEEIAELIGNINKLTSEIVESLPTENISTSTIYLIKDGDTNNYKQYMYISGAWAQLSDTNIDLSGYAKLTDLDTKVDKVEGKTLSTNDFTNVLKSKLDGIASGANKYTHPTNSGNKHIPSGGSSGQILRWSADGTAIWGDTLSTLENCAATHNGIFRGKDLTNVYSIDEICSRISAGTFEDLYIGDYFDITISSEYRSNEVVRCVFAGFDTYLHNGSASLEKHHAAIVPKNCFADAHQMNSTNTTGQSENTANASGLKAYAGSDMHNIVLPKYATAISNAIGSSHLIKRTTVLSNDMNPTTASCAGGGHTGASTGWEWHETYLQLLSEVQVYGTNVLSSSFFDTGESNLQLPLFKLDSGAKVCKIGGTDTVNASNRTWWWLKNVADSMDFCNVGSHGGSGYDWASNAGGVRPIFCIG